MRHRSQRRYLFAILALAAAGAWISGELLKQHVSLWDDTSAPSGLFVRMCNLVGGSGSGCEAALRSPWAEFSLPILWHASPGGTSIHWIAVPIALLGLAYFVFIGIWYSCSGFSTSNDSSWHQLPQWLGRCGLFASIFFFGVMTTGRAPWCVWCVMTHAINFVMVVAIERGGRPMASRATAEMHDPALVRRPVHSNWEVLRVSCIAMVAIAGIVAYYHEHIVFRNALGSLRPYERLVKSLRSDPAFLLREFYAQDKQDMGGRDGEHPDEPRLVVFTDFECPGCRCNAKMLRDQVAGAFNGRLSIEVRHFPLCGTCNHAVQGDFHPNACEAARAAEAARGLGGTEIFGQMCELLFERRSRLSADLYPRLAERIGLDAARFKSEMNSETVRAAIDADIALAQRLGVKGTPVMFLNGRRVPPLCQTPVFWEAVAREDIGEHNELAKSVGDLE